MPVLQDSPSQPGSPTTRAALRHMQSMREMLRNDDDSEAVTAAKFQQAARRISMALHVSPGWKSVREIEEDGAQSSHPVGASHGHSYADALHQSHSTPESVFLAAKAQLSSSEHSHGALRPKLLKKHTFAHRHDHAEEQQQWWAHHGDGGQGVSTGGHRNALKQNVLPAVARCAVNTFELAVPGESAERSMNRSPSKGSPVEHRSPSHERSAALPGQSPQHAEHGHFGALPVHGDGGAFRGRQLRLRDHQQWSNGKQGRQAMSSPSRKASPKEGQARAPLPQSSSERLGGLAAQRPAIHTIDTSKWSAFS